MESRIYPGRPELPPGYRIGVVSGQKLLADPDMVNQLQEAWAISYRLSTEASQSGDPKYLNTPQAAVERVKQIGKELGQKDSLVAIVRRGDEVVGFFWGLSMRDLKNIDPEKAKQVETMIGQSSAAELSKDMTKTAYLSMLGVVSQSGGAVHTGKKLGQILTNALTDGFAARGFNHVVARTINPLAWEKTYKPLGFNLYGDAHDKQAGAKRYFFGKKI